MGGLAARLEDDVRAMRNLACFFGGFGCIAAFAFAVELAFGG